MCVCQKTFAKLKPALTTTFLLFFPMVDEKIILDTDAFGHEIGAISD